MIGETLGHYRIVAQLGAGGMGAVYRAEDQRLKREVAIKLLPAATARHPEALARFQREAEALAALSHPNIVSVYSVEEERGRHFITMELVSGEGLDELIAEGGLPPSRFLPLATSLADALAEAHDRGIVHRDLKPANIVLDGRERPKILDFGLAKLDPGHPDAPASHLPTRAVTREGTVLGTLPYMSPEQIEGRPADARSDLFSLGIVLYEMATGRHPFDRNSEMAMASAILRDEPAPLPQLEPSVLPGLEPILARCLAKEPAQRYPSGLALRDDLNALAGPISPPPGIGKRPHRARGRYQVVIGGVVATVLAALIALWPREPTDAPPTLVTPFPARIDSLVVLPFDNLMDDPDQDYFVEGFHDALTTELSRLGSLKVISRTSAMRFKESELSLPEIARTLGVDAVVEGSVLRAGQEVRITAQLIDGRDDSHLWADSYDRELADVLSLLSEIARAVSSEIEVVLTPEQEARLGRRETVDPEALEALLRGEFHVGRLTAADLRLALERFHEALAIDPHFARAHAGLASAHMLLGFFGVEPRDESARLARVAARAAQDLDPGLSSPYVVLGWLELSAWNFEEAALHLERARELNSSEPFVYHGLADLSTFAQGHPEAAVALVLKGREYDPLSQATNLPVAAHLVFARRYSEALWEAQRLVADQPANRGIRRVAADALWYLGRRQEAIDELRSLWETDAELLAVADRHASDDPTVVLGAVADHLARRHRDGLGGSFLEIARLYGQAGEVEASIAWLESAYEARVPQTMFLAASPAYDALHADPRFLDLARRIGVTLAPKPPGS